ncbi:MAG: DUF3568 domain-containing protein [Phycisphaerales bacterium]|nr:DUF3568 domain-containing protein [Phycisphaerales bacterium]
MIRSGRAIAVLLLGATALPLASCITPIDLAANAGIGVAQAGTSIYSQGTLQAAFSVPMDRVVDAVRSEMKSLQYDATHEDAREETVSLTFRQADGSDISIKARRSSPTVTGFAIRVGFWGDPAVSRLILERVTAAIEKSAPADPVTPAPDSSATK